VTDPFALRRFSVAEYHKMIDAGILTPNDRVELLEGWIVQKMPQNPPHSSSVGRVNRCLGRILPNDWSLRVQCPITLSESEPEPDIVVARGKEGTYDKRHPKPTDIGLVMEIADSSLLEDRRYKGALYAREKIAEFWLMNVNERKIEVHTRPRGGRYHKTAEFAHSDLVPLVLDGKKIADIPVAELIAKM
jgi:Uma2 family endonuclease